MNMRMRVTCGEHVILQVVGPLGGAAAGGASGAGDLLLQGLGSLLYTQTGVALEKHTEYVLHIYMCKCFTTICITVPVSL